MRIWIRGVRLGGGEDGGCWWCWGRGEGDGLSCCLVFVGGGVCYICCSYALDGKYHHLYLPKGAP